MEIELRELLKLPSLKILQRKKIINHSRLGTMNYRELLKLIEKNNININNIEIILDDNSVIDDFILD